MRSNPGIAATMFRVLAAEALVLLERMAEGEES